jgi:hypothetical protein
MHPLRTSGGPTRLLPRGGCFGIGLSLFRVKAGCEETRNAERGMRSGESGSLPKS